MKTNAVHSSTTPPKVLNHSDEGSQKPQNANLTAALGLSWQLAVVVLVPIVIGLKLDSHFGSSPVYTLSSFAVAMAAMVVVVWRQAKAFSPQSDSSSKRQNKEDNQ